MATIGAVGLVGSALVVVRMVPRPMRLSTLAAEERLDPEVEPYSALQDLLTECRLKS